MNGSSQKWQKQRGVSLAETLIVVVIIAIVASLALMQFAAPNSQFKRQSVARELKVAFERARFDSVKRHAEGAGPATVMVDTNSYTLTTDLNHDGTFQSSESVVKDLAAQNITIEIAGGLVISPPVTVTFDKRGEATAADSEFAVVPPSFYVCNGSCPQLPQTPTSSNADLVLVTPTGTVNLLGGAATPPVFGAPVVTNPAANISNVVRLP
jgi:prepilin-type N-terminal cleavage/methylation domain-containing protein